MAEKKTGGKPKQSGLYLGKALAVSAVAVLALILWSYDRGKAWPVEWADEEL